MKIAVFNAEARKAVSIIRSLGGAGHDVITFSFERISFAAASRHVRRNYFISEFDTALILARLRENGVELIFPIEELIAYVSAVCTLTPGDLIFTGTPPGVGFARKPPVFLKPGDRVEVEIERLGILCNPVVAEGA